MDDNKYNLEFSIITFAGDAKSTAFQAVEYAKKFDFENAEKILEEAQSSLAQAHQVQTDMIVKAARGEEVEVNIFLVHAQDHLTAGMTAIENAKQFIDLYKQIYELKNK